MAKKAEKKAAKAVAREERAARLEAAKKAAKETAQALAARKEVGVKETWKEAEEPVETPVVEKRERAYGPVVDESGMFRFQSQTTTTMVKGLSGPIVVRRSMSATYTSVRVESEKITGRRIETLDRLLNLEGGEVELQLYCDFMALSFGEARRFLANYPEYSIVGDFIYYIGK